MVDRWLLSDSYVVFRCQPESAKKCLSESANKCHPESYKKVQPESARACHAESVKKCLPKSAKQQVPTEKHQLDLEVTLQEFDPNCLGVVYLLLLDEVLLGRQLGQVIPDQPP